MVCKKFRIHALCTSQSALHVCAFEHTRTTMRSTFKHRSQGFGEDFARELTTACVITSSPQGGSAVTRAQSSPS